MKPIATSLSLAAAVLLLSGVVLDISANAKSGKPAPSQISAQASAAESEAAVFSVLGDEIVGNCNQSGEGCRKAWEALGRVSASTNP